MDFNHFALAQTLGEICVQKGVRIGLAESCTGGSVAEVITSVAGSSAWFDSCVVVYSNEAKIDFLGVDAALLDEFGAVSEPVARAMAEGVLARRSVDLALSITGVAGPGGGSPHKPVGTVSFGLANRLKEGCETKTAYFNSGRKHIRLSAAVFALDWLIATLG